LLLSWSREVANALRDTSAPVLIRVNNSGISTRNLEELVEEISKG
jgi:hypothetical protein